MFNLSKAVAPLRADQAHLWVVGPDAVTEPCEISRGDHILTKEERQRAARFRHAGARWCFTTGRILLRSILGCHLGIEPDQIEFKSGPYGKLFLASPKHQHIRFSLSHAEGLVVAAFVLNHDVGVDVENVRPDGIDTRIAHQHFALSELHELEGLPELDRIERFFELWVLKESYTKALGVGLHLPFRSFAFEFNADIQRPLRLAEDCDVRERASTLWLARLGPDNRIALTILGHERPHCVHAYRLFGDAAVADLDCTVIRR